MPATVQPPSFNNFVFIIFILPSQLLNLIFLFLFIGLEISLEMFVQMLFNSPKLWQTNCEKQSPEMPK